jgi:nitric oxide dioxygenase
MDLKRLVEYPKEGILSKDILKTGKVSMTLFCMGKGAELTEHTSTKEGIIVVLEGKGVFNMKGKKIVMKPNVSIFMKKNAAHSLRASSNLSFFLILSN